MTPKERGRARAKVDKEEKDGAGGVVFRPSLVVLGCGVGDGSGGVKVAATQRAQGQVGGIDRHELESDVPGSRLLKILLLTDRAVHRRHLIDGVVANECDGVHFPREGWSAAIAIKVHESRGVRHAAARARRRCA